jgi:beta-glucosidase-like glycosyl hydrolase
MRMAFPRLILGGLTACMIVVPCFSEDDTSAARELESKLGQLFIVNVDGFGYSGPLAVTPGYVKMVKELQIGGVIPHYGSHDFSKIRDTNRALASLTRLPLLLCADIVGIRSPDGGSAGKVARFGDGYVGGFIGRFAPLPDEEFRTLSCLNAFMLAAIGINTALGPTVDDSTADPRTSDRARIVVDALRGCGIEPVLKHFPFLPAKGNLHRESPDTKTPEREVWRRTASFRSLRGESEILMTTHTFDSLIDAAQIVTFSPAWNAIVRRQAGFSGMLMSDDLLMLRNYADKSVLGGEARGTAVGWAERSILTGHDFIIVAGSASTTYTVFEGLLRTAAADTDAGRRLRRRILEAYGRIQRFKESRRGLLTRRFEASVSEVGSVVSAVPGDTVSADFRFDEDLRPRLAAALARASVPTPVTSRLESYFRRFFARVFAR